MFDGAPAHITVTVHLFRIRRRHVTLDQGGGGYTFDMASILRHSAPVDEWPEDEPYERLLANCGNTPLPAYWTGHWSTAYGLTAPTSPVRVQCIADWAQVAFVVAGGARVERLDMTRVLLPDVRPVNEGAQERATTTSSVSQRRQSIGNTSNSSLPLAGVAAPPETNYRIMALVVDDIDHVKALSEQHFG